MYDPTIYRLRDGVFVLMKFKQFFSVFNAIIKWFSFRKISIRHYDCPFAVHHVYHIELWINTNIYPINNILLFFWRQLSHLQFIAHFIQYCSFIQITKLMYSVCDSIHEMIYFIHCTEPKLLSVHSTHLWGPSFRFSVEPSFSFVSIWRDSWWFEPLHFSAHFPIYGVHSLLGDFSSQHFRCVYPLWLIWIVLWCVSIPVGAPLSFRMYDDIQIS